MKVSHLDHLVLTVKNIDNSVDFYTSVLGMEKEIFKEHRVALTFGNQKINLHQSGNEIEPGAGNLCPGSADLCFITETPIGEVLGQFSRLGVEILRGPIEREGASGPIMSLYLRDPDYNLIEVASYE